MTSLPKRRERTNRKARRVRVPGNRRVGGGRLVKGRGERGGEGGREEKEE